MSLFFVQAVLDVIQLTPDDKALFLSRLDSKDLSVTVDQKTLVHLLLRAEQGGSGSSSSSSGRGGSVSGGGSGSGEQTTVVDASRLHVDRIMPQHAPEGSKWRRTKVWNCVKQDPECGVNVWSRYFIWLAEAIPSLDLSRAMLPPGV